MDAARQTELLSLAGKYLKKSVMELGGADVFAVLARRLDHAGPSRRHRSDRGRGHDWVGHAAGRDRPMAARSDGRRTFTGEDLGGVDGDEQTIEAIHHARAAGVPLIVAINKIDKPDADPTRVRTDLLSHEIVVESMGGDTLEVEVSATKGTNLDKLLDAILLYIDCLMI